MGLRPGEAAPVASASSREPRADRRYERRMEPLPRLEDVVLASATWQQHLAGSPPGAP